MQVWDHSEGVYTPHPKEIVQNCAIVCNKDCVQNRAAEAWHARFTVILTVRDMIRVGIPEQTARETVLALRANANAG